MNTNELIKAGNIIAVGFDYLTDDGRVIKRVYTGRRGTTLRWKADNEDYLYRNLFEAYHQLHY